MTALLKSFQTLSRDQRQAIETRLHTLSDHEPRTIDPTIGIDAIELNERGDFPVTTALETIYTLFNQAVIGYAVLHPLATRFLDSPFIADDGTSYHLTRQHTKNYVQAIHQISRLLHDVVLLELDQDGLECQCICPSCGVGICLCAMAGRSFLSDAWAEAEPIADDEGVFVQFPKKNSAATEAGLLKGDVILGTGGQEIESYGDLQSAVRKAEPGEGIKLTVRRKSDEFEDIILVHP